MEQISRSMKHSLRLVLVVVSLAACDDTVKLPEPCRPPISGRRQICYFPKTPTLDGRTDDSVWDSANWDTVASYMGNEPADDDEDASYAFACLADSDNMYFAFRVRDDSIISGDDTECSAKFDDSVEVYINQKIDDVSVYDGDDAQIIVGAENIGVALNSVFIGSCEGPLSGSETNTRAQAIRTDDGWQVEIAVPLSVAKNSDAGWKIKPKSNRIIGFSTAYNDEDIAEETRHKLIWSESDRAYDDSWQDPSRFGELVFCHL